MNHVGKGSLHFPSARIAGFTTATGTAWATPAHDAAGNMTTLPQPVSQGSSSHAWDIGHQGLMLDGESGLYYNRARTLARWHPWHHP